MKFWFKIIKDERGITTLLFLSLIIISMGLLSPIFIIHIFNRYISFGLEGTLIFLISGAIFVAIIEYIFRNIRHIYCANLIILPIKKLKLSILKSYFDSEIYEKKMFQNNNLLDIIDIKNNIYQTLSPNNQSNILDFIFAILIVVILFFLNTFLATIFLTFLIICFSIQILFLKTKTKIPNEENSNKMDLLLDLNKKSDYLKSLNNFNFIGFYYSDLTNYQFKNLKYIVTRTCYQINFNHFCLIFNSIIVIGVGSVFVVNGFLNIGSLIGFNIFSSRALQITMNAQKSYYQLKNIKNYIDSLNLFFKSTRKRDKGLQLKSKGYEIRLKNIDFNFHTDSFFLFKNLSLDLRSGKITNISGINSSGKTTLCKILLGIYKPDSGQILINNLNLEKISLKWWRTQISFIPQNQMCLNTSILENILVENSDVSEEQIISNLKFLGLGKSMKHSNLTLKTNLSEIKSAGIHKKVHYARMLSGNKKIVIIDDPFENLDLDGKNIVLKLLLSFKKENRTIVCFSNEKEIINLADIRYNINE